MKLHFEARQYYCFLYRGYQRHRGLRMVVWGMTATTFQGIQLPMSSATVLSAHNFPRSRKSGKCTAQDCAKIPPPPPQEKTPKDTTTKAQQKSTPTALKQINYT